MWLPGGQDFQIIYIQSVAQGSSMLRLQWSQILLPTQWILTDVHSKMWPGGWMGWCPGERPLGEGTALSSLLAFLDETWICSRTFPTHRSKLNSITPYFRAGGWRRWCIGPCHINMYNSGACLGLGGFAIFQVVINYAHYKMVLPLQFSSRFKFKRILRN